MRWLSERDGVAVRIGDLHVADAVRVRLDGLVVDVLSGKALEELVEAGHGEGDPACSRLRGVRLNEERGVLVGLPKNLISGAKVWGSFEEPCVPIDAGVEIGHRDAGVEMSDGFIE
jgi:hypothetical protein